MVQQFDTEGKSVQGQRAYRLAEMTYPQLQEYAKDPKLVVLIPTGSHEQHGPHLPFATDTIIAHSIAEQTALDLREHVPVLVAPTVPYGCSTEHLDYPGTISLRPETLIDLMRDVIGSLATAGIRKILIVNGHGGNQYALGVLLHEMTRKHNIFLAITTPSRLTQDVYQEMTRSATMGAFHACGMETSLLLHLTKRLVKVDQIKTSVPHRYFEGMEYMRLWGSKYIKDFGWKTKDISPSGVIGDPESGTAAKGEILFKAAVEHLSKVITEISNKIVL